ncbi:MAG: dipeptidase [Pseudomonadota bacterium]
MAVDAILSHVDQTMDDSLERLFSLLRIPSISTDPAHKADCRRAAEWLAADLSSIGLSAEVRATTGHPVVLAKGAGPAEKPHVLLYGHYDVQPVDPLDLWDADPFAPHVVTREGGEKVIVARGACDDKGQVMTMIEALRAVKAVTGALPAGITVLIEGEEECGSPSLPGFLAEASGELKADAAFVCDTAMWDRDTPAIALSLRGLVGHEFTVRAASRDLHSGQFGGVARNPNHVVARILADLHDEAGRVTVPGFYDGVAEISDALRADWDRLGMSETRFLGPIGLSEAAGEAGRTVLEKVWARPTAEVNGVWGGYTGAGFKTVIPAEASAKVSFRLVAGQDPAAILAAFRAFVEARVPGDCSVSFEAHGAGPAFSVPSDWGMLEAGRAALLAEWGSAPAMVGMGGSIPIVHDFKHALGMDTLMIGFALERDAVHSPNESYDVRRFHKGIRSWARVFAAL